jgi:iron complex outermembrane receptor protein
MLAFRHLLAGLLGIATLCIFTGSGRAEESPASAERQATGELEELQVLSLEELLNMKVVTASGVAEDRSLAPASVFVVTREDIDRRGYHSLAEVLSAVPGLYVTDDLVTPALSVRGVSSGFRGGTRIVRIMIDGVQVSFRPDLTAFIGPEYIPMEAIDHVEIAKGPLSALYGANAFLATINIITRVAREGSAAELDGRISHINVPGSYGLSGAIAQGSQKTSFLASFQTEHADRSGLKLQQTFAGQSLIPGSLTGESQGDTSQRTAGFAVLRTSAPRLGSLTLEGGLQHMEAVGEFQLNSLLAQGSMLAINNYWANARWDRTWLPKLSTMLSLGWSHGNPTEDAQLRLTDVPGIIYRPRYRYTAFDGKLETLWTPTAALSVTTGIDTDLDFERVLYYTEVFTASQDGHTAGDSFDVSMGPNDARDVLFRDLGAYAQASWVPPFVPDLHLALNGRLDSIKQGDIEFPLQMSWRGSGAYRFSPKLTVKIFVGRAFQTPSAVLTYARPGFGNSGNFVGSAILSGTPPVKPQSVTSAEIGVTARIGKVLSIDMSAYYQNVQNSIQFLRFGTNFRAANLGTLQNLGLEGTLRYALGRFSSYLNITLQGSVDDHGLSTTPPEGYPDAFGSIGVDVDIPEAFLRTHADVGWASARGASQGNIWLNNSVPYTLNSYVKTNLVLSTASLHLLGGGAETRFLLRGQNLLNTHSSEPGYGGFDLPMLGRIITAEARISF